jgi:hypothetical protein
MKHSAYAVGVAGLLLQSTSAAWASDAIRPAQSPAVTKSWMQARRASPKLQNANHDGLLIPIVIAGVVAGGTVIYFATKEDHPAMAPTPVDQGASP